MAEREAIDPDIVGPDGKPVVDADFKPKRRKARPPAVRRRRPVGGLTLALVAAVSGAVGAGAALAVLEARDRGALGAALPANPSAPMDPETPASADPALEARVEAARTDAAAARETLARLEAEQDDLSTALGALARRLERADAPGREAALQADLGALRDAQTELQRALGDVDVRLGAMEMRPPGASGDGATAPGAAALDTGRLIDAIERALREGRPFSPAVQALRGRVPEAPRQRLAAFSDDPVPTATELADRIREIADAASPDPAARPGSPLGRLFQGRVTLREADQLGASDRDALLDAAALAAASDVAGAEARVSVVRVRAAPGLLDSWLADAQRHSAAHAALQEVKEASDR